MRTVIAFALACAGFAAAQTAFSETLRCGSVLIQPGDDAWYVLENCGEPAARTALITPVLAGSVNGNVYNTAFTRADRWLYRRDPGQFRAVVSIGEDGRVRAIDFPRVRD